MLKRLWMLLFDACKHEWVILKRVSVYDSTYYRYGDQKPTHFEYELQCKHCGDVKKKRL